MNPTYAVLSQMSRQRVSDGATVPLLLGCASAPRQLVLVWPQLGDFDSLESAWWLQRAANPGPEGLVIRAVGIGDRAAGQRFCDYTGFPAASLFVDPDAELHRQLGLYAGLSLRIPGLAAAQAAYVNLLLMCVGIGSPGTLAEVFRGYVGDRQAPQLIADDEQVRAMPLPPVQGSLFRFAGGTGFQRPFELATLRLRNMGESLSQWRTYVSNPTHLTQRGATFLFDAQGELRYEHRDRGLLGFAANMSQPLAFLSADPESAKPHTLRS